MGIAQVDGVLTEFGSLIPGLQAGRFDIIAAGMFVNPKRCEQVHSPSRPTASARRSWSPKGNPKGVADYGSIAATPDLKLAVMSGAVEAGYANDSGVAEEQIV